MVGPRLVFAVCLDFVFAAQVRAAEPPPQTAPSRLWPLELALGPSLGGPLDDTEAAGSGDVVVFPASKGTLSHDLVAVGLGIRF